jgi:hypothetical protein
MKRELLHPIETIRTAPVYIGLILLDGASVTAIDTLDVMPNTAIELVFTTYCTATVVALGASTRKAIKLRNRVEEALSNLNEHPEQSAQPTPALDEDTKRWLSPTTKTYCARQATLVACQNTGYAEQYLELCKQNAGEAQFTWLPHV